MVQISLKEVGTGGSWRVMDEQTDPSVIKQITPFSCVAAVGEMLLRSRGILVSQQAIIDIIGEPADIGRLADCLNQFDEISSGQIWKGLIILRKDLKVLVGNGQFGAVLRDGSPLGHLVMVNGNELNNLVISDPWDSTIYKISLFEFFRHWNGEVIFRWSF